MKECSRCNKAKDNFYKSKVSKDGMTPWCIECMLEYSREYDKKNIQKRRKYQREKHRNFRNTTPKNLKKIRDRDNEYQKNKRKKRPELKVIEAEKYRKRYPERISANRAVHRAIKNGKIKRSACVKCGVTLGVKAHHPDYSKPLDVVWVCEIHHRELHKVQVQIKNNNQKNKMAYEEIKNKTVKFNQIGDYVAGTLVEVIKGTKPDKYGKINNIYRIIADEGEFLGSTKNEKTGKSVLDKEITKILKDEEWTLFASGVLAGQLKRVKIGGKFMVKLTEFKPSDKGNDIKVKKVYIDTDKEGNPVMNLKWLEEQKSEMKEVDEPKKGFGDFGDVNDAE